MSSSVAGPVTTFFFVAGCLLLATLLPTLGAPDKVGPTKARLGFSGPVEAHHVRTCSCKNDWPLATNERVLSNTYFDQTASVPDATGLNSMAAFWGQFIDHDIVLSRTDTEAAPFKLQMVPFETNLTLRPVVARTGVGGCKEHANDNTPEIDSSTLYGDSIRSGLLSALRNASSPCRMAVSEGDLLPLSGNSFEAGDPRANEHSVLTSLHTVWVREHNRWCDVLEEDVPEWSDEERFWKARQLVTVEIQRITYEEWLPALFGSQASLLDTTALRATTSAMSAEFSVAAYRFGHSMIPDAIGPFSLLELFFNASVILEHGVEPVLNASLTTAAEAADDKVVDGLRNFMFSAGPMVIGEDLETRNLFRGRDVGIDTYSNLAACYGLTPVDPQADEDATIGLLRESTVAGSALPPLIARVVAEQFRRLRIYDLNFYTKIPQDPFVLVARQATLKSVLETNTNMTGLSDNTFYV